MRLSFTSSKPISSPGRAEKFPPPLMRFLRSNVGSRSKRTRRTPLFMRRVKALTSSSTAIETTQEPSSPKVTCIGQVRVRRSLSKSKNKNKDKNSISVTKKVKAHNNKCCGFQWLSLCKPKFPKWVSFFNCRSVKVRTDSSKFGSNCFEHDEQVREGVGERRVSISYEAVELAIAAVEDEMMTPTTAMVPPKNAFLLTRCRSAPYRSSSLACRFWSSPQKVEADNRASGIEMSRDSTSLESRTDPDNNEGRRSSTSSIISLKEDLGICANFKVQNSTHIRSNLNELNYNNNYKLDEKIGEVKNNRSFDEGMVKPLMLKRCKSEPARRDTEKLDPLSSEFWRHRRSGNNESSTIHSHVT